MNIGYYESKRKWYPRLTSDHPNGLLKHQTPPVDSLTVCLHYPDPEDLSSKPLHKFSIFTPLYTFANEMLKTNISERRFFEIIYGNRPQKPYFDIDISDPNISESDGLDLIEEMKKSILVDERISPADILVFSSHGTNKLSYHIIVDNWCLPDYNSNKTYCNRIISRVSDDYHMKRFLDGTMYKSIQQLRIFGNTKVSKEGQSPRFKILDGFNLDTRDKDYRFKFINILMRSLITNTSSCRILEYTILEQKIWNGSNEDLSLEEIKIIENLPFILDGTFEVLDVKGRLIPLKRKAPSFCPLCQRIHENENPYLTVSDDSSKIYIHCRRTQNDRLLIWNGESRIVMKEKSVSPARDLPVEDKSVKGSLFLKKFLGKK